MRKMARGAALSFDRRVLVNEWSEGLDVALGADGILGRTHPKKVRLECAVRVVAVSALHQPFVDPVVEWLHKGSLSVRMALIAEVRLLRFKHFRLSFKLVDAVAARATDESFAMGGPLEVGVLTNVASQALRLHLFRRCLCELKDLAGNPAALNMGLPGSVAAFARHAFAAMLERQLGMRIVVETFHLRLMAHGAGFCSDKVCRIHYRFRGRRRSLLLWRTSGLGERGSPEPVQQY
jgi:hypothetical protein